MVNHHKGEAMDEITKSYLFGLWRWFYLNRSKQIGISYWRKRLEKNRMIERQNVGHSPGEKI